MLDKNNCFTYAYSAGTDADFLQNVNGDEVSTNVIDLWSRSSLLSGESGLAVVGNNGPYIIIRSVAASSGSGTIEFRLVSSTSTTMSGDSVAAMWRFTNSQMTAGKLLVNQQMPIGKYYRYLGLYFNIYTTTCAQVLAYISDSPEPAELVLANTVAGS